MFYKQKHAELLAFNKDTALLRDTDKKIISAKIEDLRFETIPKTLLISPSLVWNVTTHAHVTSDISLDYLIRSIRWSSAYVLNLHKNTADLTGWISIDNKSGKSFKDTNLYVLAGDINRAYTPKARRNVLYKAVTMDSAISIKQNSHEGYHIYTIPFTVSLRNNEKTQIKFIEKKDIKIQRIYSARMNNPLYMQGEVSSGVMQFVKLQKLPIAIPKGIVRSYSSMKNTNILLGETDIDHTPKNTPISLKLGKNFDLKVIQNTLERNDTKYYFDVTMQYTLKNNSDTQKNITILIPFNKNKNSSIQTKQKYKFTKGNLVTLSLLVEANTQKSFQINFRSRR